MQILIDIPEDRYKRIINDEDYMPLDISCAIQNGTPLPKGHVRLYRKKPVIVEAYQTDEEIIIHTLEGDMKASVGDYIITGVNGERYPCKPDIFEKTYEIIEADKESDKE